MEAKAQGRRVQYTVLQFLLGVLGVLALCAGIWTASTALEEGLGVRSLAFALAYGAVPWALAATFLAPVVGIQLRAAWGWNAALVVSILLVTVAIPIGLLGLMLVMMGGGKTGYLQMWEVLGGGMVPSGPIKPMKPAQRQGLYQGVALVVGLGMLLGCTSAFQALVDHGWPTDELGYIYWGLVTLTWALFEGACAALVVVLLRRWGWGLGVALSGLMLLVIVAAPLGILGLWALLGNGGREGFEGKLDMPSSAPENDAPTQILRPFSAAEAPTERFDASRHAAVLEATQKPAPEPTADAPAATESPDGLDRAAVGLMIAQAVFAGLFVLVGLLGMGVGFVADRIGSGFQWQGFGVLALVALLGAALFGGLARGMKRRKGWAWTAGMVLLLPQLLMGNLLVAVPLVHLLRPKGRKEYGVGWQAPAWFDHALS